MPRKVEKLELDLSPVTTQRLDQHLEAVTPSADKRADLEGALRDFARFGSEDHPPARLAPDSQRGALGLTQVEDGSLVGM